jgi:CRP-like cAMP-binding protein
MEATMHTMTARALEGTRPIAEPRVVSPETDGLDALDSLGKITRYRRHQEIGSEATTGNWYRVVSGAAKRCATHSDGRRQIINLLMPGDFFGFGTCAENEFTVEALLEGTRIATYPRRRVEALADANPAVGRLIRNMAFTAIAQLEVQLLIVGRVTALEKVAAFLLEMGERLPDNPKDGVALPISRYDIADFLAVSVETVSRSLSGLKHRGLIRFTGTRQVRFVDREAIEDGSCACRARRLQATSSETLAR